MKPLIDAIVLILITIIWLAGIAIAKGFWGTFLAIFIPPYAWYLVVAKILILMGVN